MKSNAMNKNNLEYKKTWRFKFEKWYNKSERLIEILPIVGVFWDSNSFCLHFGWIVWECQIWRINNNNKYFSEDCEPIEYDKTKG